MSQRLSSASHADLHSVKELRESIIDSRMTTVMAPMQSELNIECDLPIVLNYQTKNSKAENDAMEGPIITRRDSPGQKRPTLFMV